VSALQVGVGGGMKSGVAFWRALRTLRDRHPCWEHLGGVPLKEADLPRPISTEYSGVFDLPNKHAAAALAPAAAPSKQHTATAVAAEGAAPGTPTSSNDADMVVNVRKCDAAATIAAFKLAAQPAEGSACATAQQPL
jgi:hypothetical protein